MLTNGSTFKARVGFDQHKENQFSSAVKAVCAGKYDLCDSDNFLHENLRYKLMEVRYSGLESIVKKIKHNMT